MNIEQIAHEVAQEIYWTQATNQEAEFLRRCLSKLAEQDVDPVGWLCNGELYEVQQYRLFPRDEPIQGQEKLYTETQLLAAQQRTAEACAKVCGMEAWAVDAMDSIRNGYWREYL